MERKFVLWQLHEYCKRKLVSIIIFVPRPRRIAFKRFLLPTLKRKTMRFSLRYLLLAAGVLVLGTSVQVTREVTGKRLAARGLLCCSSGPGNMISVVFCFFKLWGPLIMHSVLTTPHNTCAHTGLRQGHAEGGYAGA